nr:hypothetical protein [Tanacetum cinerariifolium]
MYNMKLEQFQVNTKFLNTLPIEWSKFVTDVKLVRVLHTTNNDQLHAYLGQHEYHANEALGFQNPCYLKKAQQLKPNLYDGSVIGKSDVVVVPDSEDTLRHAEQSRSKMIEKQNAPQMIEKKMITKPIDYAALNQLLTYFNTRFVPQTESSAEQAFGPNTQCKMMIPLFLVLVITSLKEQLNKLKGKAVLTEAISLNPIDPALLQVDVAPLVPKLRKNRTAHTDYIRHTQEESATFREIVESERLLSPLNTSLVYACKYTRR